MNTLFDFLNSGLQSIVPFVLLLGILIFVHELGHFLVARWCKVRVEVFSLGFGKKIIQKKVGDTVYAISLIPLGGYVKMFGDEIGKDISEEDKAGSFLHKTVWQRIAIVLAGPLMNLFFAALLFGLIAFMGESKKSPELGDIRFGTPAYEAGLRPGDKITQINSHLVRSWDEFQTFMGEKAGEKVSLQVERMGLSEPVTVEVQTEKKNNPNPIALNPFIGEVSGLTSDSFAPVLGIRSQSVAYKLGFRTGDEIKKINSFEVENFRDLEPKLIALQGQIVTIEIERYLSFDPIKFDKIELSIKLPSPLPSLNSLGIENTELYLASVVKDTPADQAGLKPFDRIVTIGEITPTRWDDILNAVKNYEGSSPLSFKIERANESLELFIEPKETEHLTMHGQSEKRKTVGIVPLLKYSPTKLVEINYSLGEGLSRAVQRSYDVSLMTVLSFVRLIQNKISPKTIGGVISIGQAASQTFQMGIQQFLTMMAIISINLFVLNLLPIPVLDGGHLLFYTIEAIRGAPLSMKKMEIAQQIGLVLLLSLMGFALFNDFSRLFGF